MSETINQTITEEKPGLGSGSGNKSKRLTTHVAAEEGLRSEENKT